MADESAPQSSSSAQNHGQAVSISIAESRQWLAILAVGLLAAYGAVMAQLSYDAAKHNDMLYDLVYTHQIKEEAYLTEHGIPVDKFGELPKPKGEH